MHIALIDTLASIFVTQSQSLVDVRSGRTLQTSNLANQDLASVLSSFAQSHFLANESESGIAHLVVIVPMHEVNVSLDNLFWIFSRCELPFESCDFLFKLQDLLRGLFVDFWIKTRSVSRIVRLTEVFDIAAQL